MRAGQFVTFVQPDGTSTAAVIAAVPGSGPSGFKVLDLTLGGRRIGNVPHEADKVAGKGFWIMYGAPVPPGPRPPRARRPNLE